MPITAYKYTICLLGVLPMLRPELSAMFFFVSTIHIHKCSIENFVLFIIPKLQVFS